MTKPTNAHIRECKDPSPLENLHIVPVREDAIPTPSSLLKYTEACRGCKGTENGIWLILSISPISVWTSDESQQRAVPATMSHIVLLKCEDREPLATVKTLSLHRLHICASESEHAYSVNVKE